MITRNKGNAFDKKTSQWISVLSKKVDPIVEHRSANTHDFWKTIVRKNGPALAFCFIDKLSRITSLTWKCQVIVPMTRLRKLIG